MFNLTGDILRQVCPQVKESSADNIAAQLKIICPQYGIDTADIFHEFIANVLHESGGFTILSESLNYSVDGLLSTFSRKRISLTDAKKYGRTATQKADQVALACLLYGGEWGKKNLGNVMPMDGWTFRGAGLMQSTGRWETGKFTEYYNKLTGSQYTAEEMSELLRVDVAVGIHSACWIFAISKQLIDEAIADDMLVTVKKINGGYIGVKERMELYEKAKQFIV